MNRRLSLTLSQARLEAQAAAQSPVSAQGESRLARATNAFKEALLPSARKLVDEGNSFIFGEEAPLFHDGLFSIDTSLFMPRPNGDQGASQDEFVQSLLADNKRLKDKLNSVVDAATESLRQAAEMQAANEETNVALRAMVQRLESQLREERAEVAKACRLMSRVRNSRAFPGTQR